MTITADRPTTSTVDAPAPAPVEAPAHVLRVLNASGDTTITWDTGNAAEVAAARALFTRLKADRYLAYRVGVDAPAGFNGEALQDFDPTAGEIVMRPQLVGG